MKKYRVYFSGNENLTSVVVHAERISDDRKSLFFYYSDGTLVAHFMKRNIAGWKRQIPADDNENSN